MSQEIATALNAESSMALCTGEVPSLSLRIVQGTLSHDNEITCNPTVIGCTSQTLVQVENNSSYHYRFWLEPSDLTGGLYHIISPDVKDGFIEPSQKVMITWNFSPTEELVYHIFWRFRFDIIKTKRASTLTFSDYEFVIGLSGVGDLGHLQAEPRLLDFDLVPIYETKTLQFEVVNVGAAVVEANLIVCHEQWLRNFPRGIIKISPTSISLLPYHSTTVSVSVRPSKADMQHFYIIYELISEGKTLDRVLDGGGGYGINVHEYDFKNDHLVEIIFVGDHAVFKVTDILLVSRHPVWDSQQCWHMFSLDLLNQYLIPYRHTADESHVPQVSTVTFRFPPAPVGSETAVFQIHLSNSMGLKGYWEIMPEPPKLFVKTQSKLKTKNKLFEIGIGKDSPELLGVIWANKYGCNSYNDFYNQSKPRDELSQSGTIDGNNRVEDEEQKCRINTKSDTFDVSPTKGSLGDKELQIITFKYKYARKGHDQISILVRVYPAIFVWIDLTAQTLASQEPFIQLMRHHSMIFQPISLSNLDPPLQLLWAYNGGNVAASFMIDLEPFERLKKVHFNHAVIDCITTIGTIPPRSWFPIKFRFSPLEYIDYSVPLIVKPDYSTTPMEILLKGSAIITATVRLRPDATISELRTFDLYDRSVPVTLCPSQITFPHFIPTGHRTTSSVFLTNIHQKNTMVFHWIDAPIEGGGCIRFQPQCGKIPPRGELACQVIIEAGNESVAFSTMVRCMMEDESEKGIFDVALNKWKEDAKKAELMMKTNPFRAHRNRHRLPGPRPSPPKSFSHLLSVSAYIGTVFGLYDVIPTKERSRMPHAESVEVNRPISANLDFPPGIVLSKFEREMSEEIISNILLPYMETMIHQLTKRQAPFYYEYKGCEALRKEDGDTFSEITEPSAKLTEEIVEAAVFNLMQELNTNYIDPETRDKWYKVAPVQLEPKTVETTEQNYEIS